MIQTQKLFFASPPRLKRHAQLIANATAPSQLTSAATTGLILLRAAQKSSSHWICGERESRRASLPQTASSDKTRGVGGGGALEVLTHGPAESAQSADRQRERTLGNRSGGDSDGEEKTTLSEHSCCLFFLCGGSRRGSLAVCQRLGVGLKDK